MSDFIGPCPHGSDPWTRCDTCGETPEDEVMYAVINQERRRADVAETLLAVLCVQAESLESLEEQARALAANADRLADALSALRGRAG